MQETLTIDRTNWLRGEGGAKSFLYRSSDQKMCCLGFYSLSRGLTIGEISDITEPLRLPSEAQERLPRLFEEGESSENCNHLMEVNDLQELDVVREDTGLTDREEAIRDTFAGLDVVVTFVN